MTAIRSGETGLPPARKIRFFERHSYWFYLTREGIDIGPYETKGAATTGCREFLHFLINSDSHPYCALP